MRILLDEHIPRKLRWRFSEIHEIVTVPERGWSGKENGDLLSVAEEEFDVLVTVDGSMEHQQSLSDINLGVVSAPSNRYRDLLPLMDEISEAVGRVQPGRVVHVAA